MALEWLGRKVWWSQELRSQQHIFFFIISPDKSPLNDNVLIQIRSKLVFLFSLSPLTIDTDSFYDSFNDIYMFYDVLWCSMMFYVLVLVLVSFVGVYLWSFFPVIFLVLLTIWCFLLLLFWVFCGIGRLGKKKPDDQRSWRANNIFYSFFSYFFD